MSGVSVTPAIRVSDLSVTYGDKTALSHVDIEVQPGTTVAVIGPNGSGKSTLLGAIAGLITPRAGSIEVDRNSLALVLQATDVDRSLPITVLETVRMARYPRRGMFGRLRADDHAAIGSALKRTGVEELTGRQLHELSGGQRQRVLVAQGLAQEASVLLLDEPVTGLDIVSREVILDVIGEERAAGRSVITTTHSLEDAADCDLVALLAGRMVAFGTPAEVLTEQHLNAAFGGRVLRLADGQLLLDDPHHLTGSH